MKNVLVTGASSGFGKLLTQQLSASGKFKIIAAMRNGNSSNQGIADELQTLPHVEVINMDVTDQHEVTTVVNAILQKYNTVDVLVNNAGVFGGGLLEAHSIAQINKLFDVNVYGPLRLMKAVLPGMRKRKEGLIINISSMLGFFSIPLNSVYCASKFALEALVTGSYAELIRQGVESILVEPGTFPTELYQKAGIKADLSEVTQAYNGQFEEMTTYASKAVYQAIQQKKPDPQAVINKIIGLIEMEKGHRPLRNPIDQISGEVFAQKVSDDIGALAETQMKAYGF